MTSRNPNSDDIYGSADVEAEWNRQQEDEMSDATPMTRQRDIMQKKPSKLAVTIDTKERGLAWIGVCS